MKIQPKRKLYNIIYITPKQIPLGLFTKKEMIIKGIIGNPKFIICESSQI